jgi:hypothetical protein
MLIPSSPSLLEHLTNYTTWIPDMIQPFSVRSWPYVHAALLRNWTHPPLTRFPLGSSEQSDKTLVDEAIETFGISVPLLEFHDIKTRCIKPDHWQTTGKNAASGGASATTGKTLTSAATTDMEEDEEEEEDDVEVLDEEKEDIQRQAAGEDIKLIMNKLSRKTILQTTKGKPVLESHPYVVTR